MERVVILSGVRTPIGAFGGSMKAVPVYELGALVLNEAIKRSGLQPAHVEEVIWANPTRMENAPMPPGSLSWLRVGLKRFQP